VLSALCASAKILCISVNIDVFIYFFAIIAGIGIKAAVSRDFFSGCFPAAK